MIRTIQTNDGRITHRVLGSALEIDVAAACIAWNCQQAVNVFEGEPLAFDADESRPMENVWDAVTGITAYARGIVNQNDRVAVERIAGGLLAKAA